jgi:hypothetical protein
MTTNARWKLTDPVTTDVFTFENNPNVMSSMFADRQTITGPSNPRFGGIRAIRRLQAPTEFSFGGIFRTQTQYEALVEWCAKEYAVELSDHFDRSWSVLLNAFDPEEQRPSQRVSWKGTYRVRGLVLGEL